MLLHDVSIPLPYSIVAYLLQDGIQDTEPGIHHLVGCAIPLSSDKESVGDTPHPYTLYTSGIIVLHTTSLLQDVGAYTIHQCASTHIHTSHATA
jgi:hypothetical protein